jgi:hypothetical protein
MMRFKLGLYRHTLGEQYYKHFSRAVNLLIRRCPFNKLCFVQPTTIPDLNLCFIHHYRIYCALDREEHFLYHNNLGFKRPSCSVHHFGKNFDFVLGGVGFELEDTLMSVLGIDCLGQAG